MRDRRHSGDGPSPRHRGARSRTLAVRSMLLGVIWSVGLVIMLPVAATAQVCPTPTELEVLTLINQERLAAGRPPLEIDVRLVDSARRHSEDMASNNFVDHIGTGGSTFVQRIWATGYSFPRSENVAAGYTSPAAVVAAWMNSAGHRSNILDGLARHVGVGFAASTTSTFGRYWTTNFGMDPGSPLREAPGCTLSPPPGPGPAPAPPPPTAGPAPGAPPPPTAGPAPGPPPPGSEPAPGAPPPPGPTTPQFALSANQAAFTTGETLVLPIQVNTAGASGTADLFFGVLMPDGHTLVFFTDFQLRADATDVSHLAALQPMIAGINLARPFTLSMVAAYTFTGDEPQGTYTFFLAAMIPGALADGYVDPADVVLVNTVPFTFTR